MKKVVSVFLLSFGFLFISPAAAFAHCPLCVAGAGAGLTLSRFLGIDDSITGIWLAAFLGAISFWSERPIFKLLRIKPGSLRAYLRPVIYFIFFATTIISFYQFNLINRMSQLFGLDKLVFGMVAGGILFYVVDLVNDYLISRNGRVYFPYQRIVVSLGSILIASLVDYIAINYYI